MKMPDTRDSIVGCKDCGKGILFARTEDGKLIPVDAEEIKTVMLEMEDNELKVRTEVHGNRPHNETCRSAGAPREGEPKAGETRPAGTEEQDKCDECSAETSFRTWTPPGSTKVLQFWDCSAKPSCGKWWNTQGSDYSPTWKAATEEQQREAEDRRAKREGQEGEDVPW